MLGTKSDLKCIDCGNALVLVVGNDRFWGCAVSTISSLKAEHARSPGCKCGPEAKQWEPRTAESTQWDVEDLRRWGL